ncbi:MAG: geranylgeranylglyceryl/heptaprenylglyceryl phosphate synthase [Candidatus Diapherotrites archaeon]|nr:geranylgeranylglyceryl/heptaprenylglyceryl phosphate synthase [Candidatus Diapherotrites archaeon]
MKPGKVERYIGDYKERGEGMLMILIDPCDHPSPDVAAQVAKESVEGGADLILVGGSIGAQGELLDTTTKLIRENVNVPINLFPGNVATITKHADSIYFMTMLNSRDPYWLSTAQTISAPVIKSYGLEPLPTGYIVIEPGGSVGWVGNANLVPRWRPNIAAALALAGQYMGNRFILTDCGSASPQGPMPIEMVKAVAETIDVPYIVGGGIRKLDEAKNIVKAGANAIQIGTLMEGNKNVKETVQKFKNAIKNAKQ